MFAHVKLTKDFPVEYKGIEKQLWKDIKNHYKGYEGGHIYRYNPEAGDKVRYENDDQCPLEDLGIPVPNNTIYAMAIGPDGTVFCGESERRGSLFLYMPGNDQFKGKLNPTNLVIQRQRKDTPGLIQESL